MVAPATPDENQAEVILVGCGAPLRGMGWYHAVQLLGDRCPSAKLCHIVEPWFLGAGAFSICSGLPLPPLPLSSHLGWWE